MATMLFQFFTGDTFSWISNYKLLFLLLINGHTAKDNIVILTEDRTRRSIQKLHINMILLISWNGKNGAFHWIHKWQQF